MPGPITPTLVATASNLFGRARPLVYFFVDYWLEGILPFKVGIRVLSDVKVFDRTTAAIAAATATAAVAYCRWPKIIRPLYAGVGG